MCRDITNFFFVRSNSIQWSVYTCVVFWDWILLLLYYATIQQDFSMSSPILWSKAGKTCMIILSQITPWILALKWYRQNISLKKDYSRVWNKHADRFINFQAFFQGAQTLFQTKSLEFFRKSAFFGWNKCHMQQYCYFLA